MACVLMNAPQSTIKWLNGAPPGSGTDPGCPTMSKIQKHLKNIGFYSGTVDGYGTSGTAVAVQKMVQGPKNILGWTETEDYDGPADGVFGTQSALAIQRFAKKYGGYTGPVDGVPGTNTWIGFANAVQYADETIGWRP